MLSLSLTALFALIAVSAAPAHAEDCRNAEFRTGPSAELQDCRAYEQVSPVRKFGNGVWPLPLSVGATNANTLSTGWSNSDGDRVLMMTAGGPGFADAVRGYIYPQVWSRGESGWTARAAIDGPVPEAVLNGTRAPIRMLIPNADRSGVLFTADMPFSLEQPFDGAKDGAGGAHRAAPDTSVQWLSNPPSWDDASPKPGTNGLDVSKFAVVGGSEDQSVVYFMTRQVLTAEDVTSGREWDQRWALYKVKDGVLENVGTLPTGDPGSPSTVDAAGSMSAGIDADGTTLGINNSSNLSSTLGNVNVVSRDGERALFVDTGDRSVPGRVPQLYLHRDGQPSLLISKKPTDPNLPSSGASTGVVPIGAFGSNGGVTASGALAGSGVLATGDRDLNLIVFQSRNALTDDAPVSDEIVKTYRYDVRNNTLERLPGLERSGSSNELVNPTRTLAGNIYRVSDDATRILFWTDSGGIRLWREGLPTVDLAESVVQSSLIAGLASVQFSEDSKTVVFTSRQALDADQNHPPGGQPNRTQVYRYNEGEGGVPHCVSCPPTGTAGPADFDLLAPTNGGFGASTIVNIRASQQRAVSADGERVYFTTTTKLDPRDENTTTDVYEWNADRGAPALISSGAADSRGDLFIDMDRTGDDVFFVTETQLTTSDTDDLYDLYTARVGGGLPDPPPFDHEDPCPLGSCQGPVSTGLALPNIGSVSFGGDGNVPIVPGRGRASVAVSRLKAVVGSAAKLKVRVPDAGRISVAGSRVRRTGRSASKAGTYSVKIRLRPKAKKLLSSKKRLRISAQVSYRAKDGQSASRTVKVTFKQPKPKRAKKTRKGGR